jgi:hypothetical protein
MAIEMPQAGKRNLLLTNGKKSCPSTYHDTNVTRPKPPTLVFINE